MVWTVAHAAELRKQGMPDTALVARLGEIIKPVLLPLRQRCIAESQRSTGPQRQLWLDLALMCMTDPAALVLLALRTPEMTLAPSFGGLAPPDVPVHRASELDEASRAYEQALRAHGETAAADRLAWAMAPLKPVLD